MNFLKPYYDTEGPLGFPMKDADAKARISTTNIREGAKLGNAAFEAAAEAMRAVVVGAFVFVPAAFLSLVYIFPAIAWLAPAATSAPTITRCACRFTRNGEPVSR